MNKKFQNKHFFNIETRRYTILSRNSSAAEAEKFERQVSTKASLRSTDLREYWQTGTDNNHFLDEVSAREMNEMDYPIPSPSDYVNQLNLTRSIEDKVASFSDLTEDHV